MVNIRINARLLSIKAHYFSFFGGTAPILPFIPVIGKQLGISQVGIGVIYGIIPVFGIASKTFLGSLADKFQLHKIIFISGLILTTLALFSVQYIPNVSEPYAYLSFSNDGDTNISLCNLEQECVERIQGKLLPGIQFTCNQSEQLSFYEINGAVSSAKLPTTINDENCVSFPGNLSFEDGIDYSIFNSSVSRYALNHKCIDLGMPECENWNGTLPFYHLPSFWILLLLLLVNWMAMAIVITIGDALCFHLLEDHPADYGIQRVWGTIGWGTFSMISGYLIDKVSGDQLNKDYSPAFYLVVGVLFLDIVVSLRMKFPSFGKSKSVFKDVWYLFRSVRICIFFIVVVLVGFYTGVLWQFLFWHIEDLAHNWGVNDRIKLLEGVMLGIQCFGGELPFFFVSGWIIKSLGHRNSLTIVLFCFGIRFILYSQLVNPWLVLPIELFQGVTFGLFYATMASYANMIAPSGTSATVQGLVGAAFEGIGVASGSIFGGMLFKYYSGQVFFLWLGVISVIAGVLHIVAQCTLNHLEDKPHGCRSNIEYSVTDPADEFPHQNGSVKPASGQPVDKAEEVS